MNDSCNSYDEAARLAASGLWFPGAQVELIHYSENHTYKVVDSDVRGVLRVSRIGYHTLAQIEGEVEWIRALSEGTDLLVATPMESLHGNLVETVELDGGQSFVCCMFEYVDGHAPDLSNPDADRKLFATIGRKTAVLHDFCRQWQGAETIDRPVWDCAATMGSNADWGSWEKFDGFSASQIEQLRRCQQQVEHEVALYGRDESNFGLVHSDIRFANLIQTESDICIIDFDDSALSWYMYDIACSLSFIEDRPEVPALVEAWLNGYTSLHSLRSEDIAMIPAFAMMRRLQLTGWLASHGDSDPVPGFKQGWIDGTMKVAAQFEAGTLC